MFEPFSRSASVVDAVVAAAIGVALFSLAPSLPGVLTGGGAALFDDGTMGDRKGTRLMAPASPARSNAVFPRKFVDLKTLSTISSLTQTSCSLRNMGRHLSRREISCTHVFPSEFRTYIAESGIVDESHS